jgi:molybdate transport system substrate-binding protein
VSGTVAVVSSMATRRSLVAIVDAYVAAGRPPAVLTSLGGVEALRRLRAGEVFDVVVLGQDALAALVADGVVIADSVVAFAHSPTAVAVRSGAARPAACDEASLKALIQAAPAVGLSTGPSGVKVGALLAAWSADEHATPRIVKAAVGVPVARMLAEGAVDVGFQQLSELIGEPGIDIVGTVPETLVATTVFSMGLIRAARHMAGGRDFVEFACSQQADAIKAGHGLSPGM